MIRTLVICFFFALSFQPIYGQEQIDSSAWELIIPIEITEAKKGYSEITSLSRKDFLQLPASFDDPSRLMLRFPGFVNSNDQNNGIVFHGMPAKFSGWSLYNAEILNPNHLSTAGISGDRISHSSGGVNALSGQVIGSYQYRAQPEVHTSTNFLAGVSDIKLRDPYKTQASFNASLIGMEAGLDFKKNNVDFLLNGRYSTVGLLSLAGVDFDDEKINYQDISAKLGVDLKNGRFDFYGIYGTSENTKDPDISNPQEPFGVLGKAQNGELILSGMHLEKEFGNLFFETTTNYSQLKQDNFSFDIFGNLASEILDKNLLSNFTAFSYSFDKAVLELNYRYKRRFDENQRYDVHQPGVYFKYFFTHRFNVQFGTNYVDAYSTVFVVHDTYLQPSLGLQWTDKKYSHQLSAKYSFAKQQSNFNRELFVFFGDGSIPKAHNVSLRYSNLKNGFYLNAFGHFLSSVYQNPDFPFTYSWLDDIPIRNNISFGDINASRINIYGISLGFSEKLSKRTSYQLNTTFMRGVQQVVTNFFFNEEFQYESFSIPFEIRYSTNVLLNHQFKNQRWKMSLGLHARDGKNVKALPENSFDLFSSLNDPFTEKLDPYTRIDLRVSYHFKNRNNRFKSFLSLDIQNVTNQQNVSNTYFDSALLQKQYENQLGMIPILSWRIVI